MIVISDASPLVSLARIDRLSLLRELYAEITIPPAVRTEVVVQGAGEPGAQEVKGADWIEVCQVGNPDLVRALRQELDAGEAEAIALAKELGAEFVLMDERLGREVAAHLGVRCVGTLGVLTEAKGRDLLDAVKPLLDRLVEEADFRISEGLYRTVLTEAGQ